MDTAILIVQNYDKILNTFKMVKTLQILHKIRTSKTLFPCMRGV